MIPNETLNEIKDILKEYVNEPNNVQASIKFKSDVMKLLDDVWTKGLILGYRMERRNENRELLIYSNIGR